MSSKAETSRENVAVSFVDTINAAATKLRLPGVARMLGFYLPESPGTCLSPFRDEKNPSFSWFVGSDGKDRWKDFASGERGDCVDFIVKASGLTIRDASLDLVKWAGVSLSPSAACGNIRALPKQISPAKPPELPTKPPELPTLPHDLRQATQDDLSKLIGGRGWGIPQNRLQGPAESLQLMFGTLLGHSAWLLLDRKGPSPRFFEARRLDGNAWAHGAKSHARGRKALLGAEGLKPGGLAIVVEGAPDFLAAHVLAAEGQAGGWPYAAQVQPVAMLGAGLRIAPDDLGLFSGVRVILIPHLDRAGTSAAETWAAQLSQTASAVRVLDLTAYVKPGGKDLADCLGCSFDEKLMYRVQAYSDIMKGGRG